MSVKTAIYLSESGALASTASARASDAASAVFSASTLRAPVTVMARNEPDPPPPGNT